MEAMWDCNWYAGDPSEWAQREKARLVYCVGVYLWVVDGEGMGGKKKKRKEKEEKERIKKSNLSKDMFPGLEDRTHS